ncbi:MAG: translocation/assembly module TamB [Treponema sp.]|nr:translocation/assembly module TamB [Treponema sp.]
MTRLLDKKVNALSSFIFDKTGLVVKYQSLSPSILSSISMKNISVYDSQNVEILEIKKAKIGFKLSELLKLDIQKGISSVLLDGIKIDMDNLEKIIKSLNINLESDSEFKISSLQAILPANVKLKNLDFIYDKEPYYLSMAVKSLLLSNNANKEILEIDFDSNIRASVSQFNKALTGALNISGTLTPDLNNSQVNVKLSNLTDGDFRLNKLNLYVGYKDSVLDVHTIQAVNPLSIAADFNIETMLLNAHVKSKDLYPTSILSVRSLQKEFSMLKDMKITTDTNVSCNINEKTVNFNSDTNLHCPDEVFPQGFDLGFYLSGNEKKLSLSRLKLEGERINASAQLDFSYAKQQLAGILSLENLILNNNKSISTEIYIDPLDTGFMAFSPQLFIGDKALTALQLSLMPQSDSYDFSFEAYDYSHVDNVDPALISFEGSYLTKSNYLQSNISVNSLYFDSIASFVSQLLDEKYANVITSNSDKLAPYVLSGDIFAATDFKTISYNVPYILAANTQKDNQFLMISLNGSEQNLQVDQLSFVYGKYACQASATLDKAIDSSDMFFTLDLNSQSIPYHFAGSIMPEIISITGDYGTDIEVRFDENKEIDGHFILQSLPVALLNTSVIFSTNSNFHYDQENGPELHISSFEAELAGSAVTVSPKLVFSGNMTKYGAQLDSMAYTDLYSTLVGTADLMININEGLFDSVGMMVNVKNPMSEESIIIDGNISNPYHLPLTKDNLLKYIYLNMQLQINRFSLNRFAFSQNEDNQVTATLYTSGTIEHPYVSINIVDSAFLVASDFMKLNGSMVLEDRDIDINDLTLSYSFLSVDSINAKASLTDMTMDASGNLNCDLMGKTLQAPLSLTVGNAIIPEGSIFPDSLMVTLESKAISGSLIKKQFPLMFNVLYSDKQLLLYSSENAGINGAVSDNGQLELNINNEFISGKIDGSVKNMDMDLDLYDCTVKLKNLLAYLTLDDLIMVEEGDLEGLLHIGGNMDEPDFLGNFNINNPIFKIPMLSKQKIYTDVINLNFDHNEIILTKNSYRTKKGQSLELSMNMFLNKWLLNHVEGNVKTLKKEFFPVNINTPIVKVDGDMSLDLQLYFEEPELEVTGKVFGENVSITSSIASVGSLTMANNSSTASSSLENIRLKTDLDVSLGTHAAIDFNPILRCIFVPNTNLKVKIDQDSDVMAVNGEVKLKSGDLSYLNRNFYIKSGSIKFNPMDITNPILTLSAETREKDSKNQTVKIVLSVENQYLKSLNPRFSSSPAKSENEIRTLLGQIVVADSENASNFLFAASDYAIQSTLVRSAENKLRDFLNFDIFSVRTNVLQNTLNLGFSGKLATENLTIGNFLDNSTVYIGKYLNSSIYVDAMLHVSLEDSSINNITSFGSLIFQPEFGMELESPFANIRVNVAPDINALLNNQFVPSTSLTLSWKFAF